MSGIVSSGLSVCNVGDTVDIGAVKPNGKRCASVDREVVMTIKAPHGQAVIFKPFEFSSYYVSYVAQAEAVRAFMEQHRNGG